MKKFLVAVDGSENSERALIEARDYAQCVGAAVTIITVVKDLAHRTGSGYQTLSVESILVSESEKILKESLKTFDNFEGGVNTKALKGDPADQIIREADEGGYDLIIMGSRGLGAFSKAILGSISNKVLNHTNKNVLIIK